MIFHRFSSSNISSQILHGNFIIFSGKTSQMQAVFQVLPYARRPQVSHVRPHGNVAVQMSNLSEGIQQTDESQKPPAPPYERRGRCRSSSDPLGRRGQYSAPSCGDGRCYCASGKVKIASNLQLYRNAPKLYFQRNHKKHNYLFINFSVNSWKS